MLSFRSLVATDFPQLLIWLREEHVMQWWNDGDDTLEKVALHYGAEEPDVARFILSESIPSKSDLSKSAQSATVTEIPIGYFQYYIVSPETIGIDQLIGASDRINRGIGTGAIRLFLEIIIAKHRPQQIITDPHPDNRRAIRCYEKVGFVHDETIVKADGSLAYMMRLNCQQG